MAVSPIEVVSYDSGGTDSPQSRQVYRVYYQSISGNVTEAVSSGSTSWQTARYDYRSIENVRDQSSDSRQTNSHGCSKLHGTGGRFVPQWLAPTRQHFLRWVKRHAFGEAQVRSAVGGMVA